jgi:hypothetical protein
MFVGHEKYPCCSLGELHFARFKIIVNPPKALPDPISESEDFLELGPVGFIDGDFGMGVDFGWVVDVWIDSSFEYDFEEFGFSVFTVG